MKIRIWLLLAMVAFCLLMVFQPASARNAEAPQPDRARIYRLLSRSNPRVESAPGYGNGTASARPGRKSLVANGNPPAFFLHDLAQQPNRRGPADDDQSDGGEANLASSEQPDPPLEWQMMRPDSQRANSFIHSKTKPPP